jgi:hypothetical protein
MMRKKYFDTKLEFVYSLRNLYQMIFNGLLKGIFLSLFLFVQMTLSAISPFENEMEGALTILKESYIIDSTAHSIYSDLNNSELSYQVFLKAFNGYYTFKKKGLIENTQVLTIIDFDKPSAEKRFFIVDMEKHEIVVNSYVAHGQKTGELEAQYFSNKENSHQSSLGFYLTDEIYFGKHGMSLRLDGLERGINDNARKRNIVVHSADYVSEEYIAKNNRLGRSWGCPALPEEGYEEVIDYIKDRSLLFVYSSKANYLNRSHIF